jgi:hypothetical protein
MNLRSYFNGLFTLNPQATGPTRIYLDVTKAILDFIRNLIVVGILFFFEKKTKSTVIAWVAGIAFCAMMLQLWVLPLRYNFKPFHFVKDAVYRDGLNALAYIIFFAVCVFAIYQLLFTVVQELASIQGLK